MFGQAGGTGFGFGQNNQNTGGGFGSTTNTTGGGFGTFGQPAQTQPQQTGFGSGGFGAANTQTTGGFGSTGFGQNTTSSFGQAKPFGTTATTSSGGGLFGNTANTATAGTGFGGGFGNTTTSTGFGGGGSATGGGGGLFGNKPATTGFGSGTTGLFGSNTSNNATTGFGGATNTATTGFNANAGPLQVPMNGTSNPPFEPFVEKDAATNAMNHFQTITFMPTYKNFSLEELRLQDYAQNRKVGSGPAATGFGGGFGAGFGQTQTQNSTFGQTQPATTASGLFGNAGSTSTAFGQQQQSGGFGTNTSSAGGLFGQKPAAGGLFGNTSSAGGTTGGLFGSTTTGGGFGTTATGATGFGQPASAGTGLFGQNTANQTKPTGFSFGNTGTSTGTGFGQQQQQQQPTATTGFGQTATPATGTGLFGQQNSTTTGFGQPAQQPASGGLFGGGGFGNTAQTQPTQTTGFGFGNTQAQTQTPNKPFGSGFGATTTPATAPAGGLFGATATNTQSTPSGGLFGNKFGAPNTNTTGTGLFGNTSNTTPAPTGLFGTTTTSQPSGGLFGGQNQNQTQATGGGLFGSAAKPATGGLFGASNATSTLGGGLFNNNNMQQQQQQQAQPTSLFGQQNNQNMSTGFGANNNSGLFGNNQSMMGNTNMQVNPMMQSNVLNSSLMDQRPYGNLLLDVSQMSNSPGPIATPLSASTQKKKNAMIPHHKIAPRQPSLTPRVQQPFSRSVSPFTTNSPLIGGSLGRSFSGGSSRIGLGSSLFDVGSDESLLQSNAFSPGSANRPTNLKKLVIDRKLRDADLFSNNPEVRAISNTASRDDSPKGRNALKKTVSFDTSSMIKSSETPTQTPQKAIQKTPESQGNEFGFLRSSTRKQAEESPEDNGDKSSPGPATPTTPTSSEPESTASERDGLVNPNDLKHGEYWMIPSATKLGGIPREKLTSVSTLKVGRRGYGQISFDEPVDLSALNSLDEICGGVITFGDRVCTVYPPGWTKPPPGHGLNIPATITLEDCFPTDRENKKPIRDVDHPRYQFHLKRLKNVPDTEFVDYLVQEGIWVFKVKHFTAYGLFEDDEMDEDESATPTNKTRQSETTKSPQSVEPQEDSFYSEDASYDENVDDTFEFKRQPESRFQKQHDTHHDQESYANQSDEMEADETIDESSILPYEEESAHESDSVSEDEPTEIYSPDDDAVVIEGDDERLAIGNASQFSSRSGTPEPKLGLGRDWTEQLGQTISPVKKPAKFANATPSKKSFNSLGPLDLAKDFFVANGDFESPYRASVQANKRRTKPQSDMHMTLYKETNEAQDDKEMRRCVRPTWGPRGEIFYQGNIEGGRPKGFGDVRASGLSKAKLVFSAETVPSTYTQLETQMAATFFEKDQSGIPYAKLDRSLSFSQIANLKFDDKAAHVHEKRIWQLASILFDDVNDKAVPSNDLFLRLYYRDRIRKDALSSFFKEIVHADVEKAVRAATTPEEVAVAYLSGNKVESACEVLLEGSDFRLASILPLIGGDAKVREEIKRQLSKWRQDGVLSEIAIPIRAIYELLAGNTNHSEGVEFPMEDVTPSFFFTEQFDLDWRRSFGLRLWYEIYDDEKLEEAVRRFSRDIESSGKTLQRPIPWYQEQGADHSKSSHPPDTTYKPVDVLWELLSLYSQDSMTLESVLHPRNIGISPIDYRISWQLKSMFTTKQVRDFADYAIAEQLSVDFATQLECEGQWEWAIFVLLHIEDAQAREYGIRQVLGRQIATIKEGSPKLEFIQKKLLIPSTWIYEAKALAARNAHKYFTEVDNLLCASAWNEAHRTILRYVAPICVINMDLPRLYDILIKFHNVELIDNWNRGGQVYLDYISLMSIVDEYKGFAPPVPKKTTGLPKGNSKRDISRRMLDALPKMEQKEFLQGVAISEVARILAGFVLKSEDLEPEASKVNKLPMTEDQFSHKDLSMEYNMYKAQLGIA